jgi:hypothetical protein
MADRNRGRSAIAKVVSGPRLAREAGSALGAVHRWMGVPCPWQGMYVDARIRRAPDSGFSLVSRSSKRFRSQTREDLQECRYAYGKLQPDRTG